MYVHLITFEYYYKNNPDDACEHTILIPRATSSESRIYFWQHLEDIREIEWAEVDEIYIVLVRSKYVDRD